MTMANRSTAIDQFKRDEEYYDAHYSEILGQYPDQWVAVLDGSIVGADEDVFELIDRLRSAGIPTQRTVMRRASTKPEVLIVPLV